MIYEYRCKPCRVTVTSSYRGDVHRDPCPRCGGVLKRVWSVSIKKSFQEHFNTTTQRFTRSPGEHRSHLSRLSEHQTVRTGIEHNYVPVDPADAKAVFGITDEAHEQVQEQRMKADIAEGKAELSAKWL